MNLTNKDSALLSLARTANALLPMEACIRCVEIKAGRVLQAWTSLSWLERT